MVYEDREGNAGIPQVWLGTVWYATSPDGYEWEEQGQALDRGAEDAWDGVGVYTPNILAYKGKYYLAYTAMKRPFQRYHSLASISLAVSVSPDGPWTRLPNNPMISPGKAIDAPDGFLCDDTVFVVRDEKIWLTPLFA